MSKVKKQSKQILISGETLEFPHPAKSDVEKSVNEVLKLIKQKQAKIGLNSVLKSVNKGEIKLVVVPKCYDLLEKYQPLFNILSAKKVPILALDIEEDALIQRIGNIKSVLAIGITVDDEELKKNSTTIQHRNGLPNVRVEIDTFEGKVVNKRK